MNPKAKYSPISPYFLTSFSLSLSFSLSIKQQQFQRKFFDEWTGTEHLASQAASSVACIALDATYATSLLAKGDVVMPLNRQGHRRSSRGYEHYAAKITSPVRPASPSNDKRRCKFVLLRRFVTVSWKLAIEANGIDNERTRWPFRD